MTIISMTVLLSFLFCLAGDSHGGTTSGKGGADKVVDTGTKDLFAWEWLLFYPYFIIQIMKIIPTYFVHIFF